MPVVEMFVCAGTRDKKKDAQNGLNQRREDAAWKAEMKDMHLRQGHNGHIYSAIMDNMRYRGGQNGSDQ